jgi:hypothetical protein
MDEQLERRLAELESKVDRVLVFTDRLEALFGAWLDSKRGRLITAATKGVRR